MEGTRSYTGSSEAAYPKQNQASHGTFRLRVVGIYALNFVQKDSASYVRVSPTASMVSSLSPFKEVSLIWKWCYWISKWSVMYSWVIFKHQNGWAPSQQRPIQLQPLHFHQIQPYYVNLPSWIIIIRFLKTWLTDGPGRTKTYDNLGICSAWWIWMIPCS